MDIYIVFVILHNINIFLMSYLTTINYIFCGFFNLFCTFAVTKDCP